MWYISAWCERSDEMTDNAFGSRCIRFKWLASGRLEMHQVESNASDSMQSNLLLFKRSCCSRQNCSDAAHTANRKCSTCGGIHRDVCGAWTTVYYCSKIINSNFRATSKKVTGRSHFLDPNHSAVSAIYRADMCTYIFKIYNPEFLYVKLSPKCKVCTGIKLIDVP